MPKVTRIAFRTGATAASLGASALGKTADILRGLSGDASQGDRSSSDQGTEVPVEHRGEARRLEPVVAPERQPENPAAPAGADPGAQSGTGPVPRRISNPKAARKVRKRQADAGVGRLETKQSGKGARPATSKAEPSPAELAEQGEGRRPAPMGSQEG